MIRADYNYIPLSEPQYEQIIEAGTMQGTSPIHGSDNWASFDAACKSGNVDPRMLLSALLWEDHFGTDPKGGVELARAFNFGGIKFVTPAPDGWYDSGIPCPPTEGGTYAGFRDFGSFILALIDTLENEYCGPAFKAGDLAGAWAIYVGGPNNPNHAAGQDRVDQWQYYVQHYPPQGGTPVPDQGVYGEDLIAKLETQIGHADSGTFDTINGNHPWAFFCLAGVQAAAIACGLSYTLRPTALAKYQAAFSQGLIQTGEPEHGAQVFLGTQFYAPDGHTGLWHADKRQLLGTLTDGTGVGYRGWGPGTVGYLGWMRIPGVVAPRRSVPIPIPDPPMEHNFIPPGNPWNTSTDPAHQVAVGGANKREYLKAPEVFGFPITNEVDAYVLDGKMSGPLTVQVYENLTTAYDKPSDTIWVLKPGARIIPKEARP